MPASSGLARSSAPSETSSLLERSVVLDFYFRTQCHSETVVRVVHFRYFYGYLPTVGTQTDSLALSLTYCMTKSELLNIVIKVFGLYYFVLFAQHLMEFIYMMVASGLYDNSQSDRWIILGGIFMTFFVDLVFAYFALFKTELITNRISRNNEGTVELGTTKTDLLEISFAVVAIVAILNSIPNLLTQQVNSIYYHDHRELEFWTTNSKNELFQNLFILIAGIFLLLNSRNFAKWITKRGEQDDSRDEQK
ncbi:hypothetical protein [Ekhidna sp.]|uniref:hypothetical protein n=1 Tax=Ekhidna sp. TaxID=2608089 RepID=UPI003B5CF4BD